MSNQLITIPLSLISDTPNNYELGEKIRNIANEQIKKTNSIFPDNVEYTDEYYKKEYINPYNVNKKQ
jgi:hypothetical protein